MKRLLISITIMANIYGIVVLNSKFNQIDVLFDHSRTRLDAFYATIKKTQTKISSFEKEIEKLKKKIAKLKEIKIPELETEHSGTHIEHRGNKWNR